MNLFIKKRALLFGTAVVTAMSLTACGGDGNGPGDLGDRLGINNPSVRFVNAVPNTSLSLYRNGQNDGLDLMNNIAYSGITKFRSFKDENSTFSVRSNNAEVGTAGSINGAKGHRYLAVAFPVTTQSTIPGVSLEVLDDPYNRNTSVAPTVRLVNAVVNATPVDVYVTNSDQQLSNPTVPNFEYKTFWPASGRDSHRLDTRNGRFRVRITAAGNPGTVLFDSKTINIAPNADAIITILPTRLTTAGTTASLPSRGDLKIVFDDGFQGSRGAVEIQDQP
ncbi:hypothetical protein C5615_38450 [Burkholderia cepacia]|uniref:Uncharacterized protein n=1 Tax=Burkholderia cepacia TaxID=292 RepID=A0A2S8HWA3_BURCE|nr:DUF4397 domain-containing protein [Burkholderia cepacia]PQP06751.1 hypothetical protein C5615_38450 [Burkholderia cepacia]HDR9512225.1 DUF4397 domain-containing protein [Burkholderia cepacia]